MKKKLDFTWGQCCDSCDGLSRFECKSQTSVPGVWSPFDVITIISISDINSCPTFSTLAQIRDGRVARSGVYGTSFPVPSGFKTAAALHGGAGISSYPLILVSQIQISTSTILYEEIVWLPPTGKSFLVISSASGRDEREGFLLLYFQLFLTSQKSSVWKF